MFNKCHLSCISLFTASSLNNLLRNLRNTFFFVVTMLSGVALTRLIRLESSSASLIYAAHHVDRVDDNKVHWTCQRNTNFVLYYSTSAEHLEQIQLSADKNKITKNK